MSLSLAKSILPAFHASAMAVAPAPSKIDATKGLDNPMQFIASNIAATSQLKNAGREAISLQANLAVLAAKEIAAKNLGLEGRPERGSGFGSPALHAGGMVGGSIAANMIGGVAQVADAVLGPVGAIAGAASWVMSGNGVMQPSYSSNSTSSFALFNYKDADGGIFPSAMPASQTFDNTVVMPTIANGLGIGPKSTAQMKNPMEEEYKLLRDSGMTAEQILKQATLKTDPVKQAEYGLRARGQEMDDILSSVGRSDMKLSFGSKSGQFTL